VPKVECNCTYRQSLHHLRSLSDRMILSRELDSILRLNVLRLLGVGD
jgi:hypothetical protein